MAKKKQDLTPEERLAAALVPEEEWPYALPDGWKWVYLGKITTIVGGGTPSSRRSEYYNGGTIPWITPADLSNYNKVYISHGKKNITQQGLEKSSAKLMPANTVLLSSRAPIGYVAIAANDICTNQGFKSFLPSVHFAPKYLYWFLKGNQALLEQYASGTTFLELSGRRASEIKFPIAPLSEQRRLVARIESLFAKLDAAKEKVQSVLDSHETRKAALLHAAFAGKLTAKWQEEQSAKISSWKTMSFEDCIEKMQNGLSKRRGDSGEYVNVLRLTNIAPESLSFQDMRKILLTPDEKKKYKLAPEDVLMVRVNGSKDNVGKQLYIDKKDAEHQLTFCDHLIRIHYNEQLVSPRFMVYFSHTMQYKSYIEKNMVSSAGQNTISRKGMKNLSLRLPSLPEQQEIVRILDRLLAREQRARQAAEETLAAIDRMKQSILARAFRGEL